MTAIGELELDEHGFVVLPALIVAGPFIEIVPCPSTIETLYGGGCLGKGLKPKKSMWCGICQKEYDSDPDAFK